MYVQKKMMAKLEQERLADLANVNQQHLQQQQLDALKTFASLQQMNSTQQHQQTLTAFLAAMMNKNFILNQQLSSPVAKHSNNSNNSNHPNSSNSSNHPNHPNSSNNASTTNATTNCKLNHQSKSSNLVSSRKRSHSELDASSSEEEPYCKTRWVD